MNLFNLPNSILIKIYEYDNTYQEILRKVLKTDLNKTIMDKHMKSLDIYENHILKTLTHKISLNPSNKIPYKDEIKISYMTEGRVNIYIKNLFYYWQKKLRNVITEPKLRLYIRHIFCKAKMLSAL